MKYNFDQIMDRRNTNSLKWHVGANELPMWVADMDFQTAPEITAAIQKKAELGIFGYQIVPDEWYDAIQGWWSRRHQFEIKKEWLLFCTGVVPTITCAVKRFTNIGDNVLVQTPVYDIFFHSIENQGRHVLESPLVYEEGCYHVDYIALEEKLAHPLTTMMILCNPHNPIGRIWTREELIRIGELCEKHHVLVCSDEIHCDITEPGTDYVPYAAASRLCRDNSISCISATKAFNLAGLQTAAILVPRQDLRQIMDRGINSDEVSEPNCFAIEAVISAFRKGEEWLEELREYISHNRSIVTRYLEKELPQVRLLKSDATYLLWIDCSSITDDTDDLCDFIRKETGLFLTAGGQYRGNSRQFIRMNVACSKIQLQTGLELFKKGVEAYENKSILF